MPFTSEFEKLTDPQRQAKALLAGEPTYVATERCRHDHTPVRYARTNQCVDCSRGWRRRIIPSEETIANAIHEAAEQAGDAAMPVPETKQPARGRTLREVARAFGCSTFQSIEPCIHGHHSPRSVQHGHCIECHNARSRVR